MTTKEFTIFIDQDEELSRKTREAFKQGCSARLIDDEEIAALPSAWSRLVTFEEGVALLDRVLADRAGAYCATTIENGMITEICCNSPVMLHPPVISARILRRTNTKKPSK